MDTPPTPTPPRSVKPSAKGMGQALKDPKVLVAVAVVGVIMALYFRSRQTTSNNLPASDGSSTPIGDYSFYPDETQGATTGAYGGFDSPTMNQPDWLTDPPTWVLDPPTWWGPEPPATNSSNPSTNGVDTTRPAPVVFAGGNAVYDPAIGQTFGAPVTGGGPPTTPNHAAPPKAGGNVGTLVKVKDAETGQIKTNKSGNKNDDRRYKTVKRKVGKKTFIFHDYESKPGKADWGKGGSVNMGPA